MLALPLNNLHGIDYPDLSTLEFEHARRGTHQIGLDHFPPVVAAPHITPQSMPTTDRQPEETMGSLARMFDQPASASRHEWPLWFVFRDTKTDTVSTIANIFCDAYRPSKLLSIDTLGPGMLIDMSGLNREQRLQQIKTTSPTAPYVDNITAHANLKLGKYRHGVLKLFLDL